MNEELKKYIEFKYYPMYESLNDKNIIDHINDTIRRSFELKKSANLSNLDDDIIYLCAALHDIGKLYGDKYHGVNSAKIILKDVKLTTIYSKEEIEALTTAIKEHSESTKHEPSSIYGKVLADANKELDINKLLYKTYEHTLKDNPDLDELEESSQLYFLTFKHLNKAYCPRGKAKFFISSPEHTKFQEEFKSVLKNPILYTKKLTEAVEENKKESSPIINNKIKTKIKKI